MGMMSGVILPVLGATMYFGSVYPGQEFPRLDSVLRLYRMLGVAILLVWFWYNLINDGIIFIVCIKGAGNVYLGKNQN